MQPGNTAGELQSVKGEKEDQKQVKSQFNGTCKSKKRITDCLL